MQEHFPDRIRESNVSEMFFGKTLVWPWQDKPVDVRRNCPQ